jgi:hypothetical protein
MQRDYAPRELTQLPFNLYRTQVYPPNPPLFEQAVQDQLAGKRAVAFLPQHMAYTKWKNPEPQWSSSATGVMEASSIYSRQVSALAAPFSEGKGIYLPVDAARDLNRLPQPMDNWQFDKNPIARGMYNFPIAQGSSLMAYSRVASQPGQFNPQPLQTYTPIQAALTNGEQPAMTSLGRVARGIGRTGKGLGALGDTSAGSAAGIAWGVLGLAGLGLGLYHGWHRTHKTGWTVGWGVAGALVPVFTIPLILIQGVGKK